MKKTVIISLILALSVFAFVAPATSEPAQTKTLVATVPAAFVDLHPYASGNSYYDLYIQQPIYQTLFTIENETNKNPIPMLAKSGVASNEGMTWTVELKQGVTFTNGDTMNVTDVLFSFLLGGVDTFWAGNSFFKTYLGDNVTFWGNGEGNGTHQTFEVVDEYTFKLNLVKFYPFMLENMLVQTVLSHQAYGHAELGFAGSAGITNNSLLANLSRSIDSHPANTNVAAAAGDSLGFYGHDVGPVGTGPMKFASIAATDDEAKLVKNPDYNNALITPSYGVSNFDEIIVKTILSPSTAKTALINGEIDLVDSNTGLQDFVPEIEADPYLKVEAAWDNGFQHVVLNQQNPYFGVDAEQPYNQYKTEAKDLFANGSRWENSTIAGERIKGEAFHNSDAGKDARGEARLMLRKAFDSLIPRPTIVSAVTNGFSRSVQGTHVIPQQQGYNASYYPGYNSTHPYYRAGAIDLMEEATGMSLATMQSWDCYPDSCSWATTFFPVTMFAPTTNYKRTLWASSIAYELSGAGVDAQVKWLTWQNLYPKALTPENVQNNDEETGLIYADGGMDGFFVGHINLAVFANLRGWFHTESYAPGGSNYIFVNNSDLDGYIEAYENSYSLEDRRANIEKVQQIIWENKLSHVIVQEKGVFAMAADLQNWDTYNGPGSLGHVSRSADTTPSSDDDTDTDGETPTGTPGFELLVALATMGVLTFSIRNRRK